MENSGPFLKTYDVIPEAILQTIRQPFFILDADLKVRMANRSFYETFQTRPEDTLGRIIFDLAGGQWNIPRLRELLEDTLPHKSEFSGCEVEGDFPEIGHKVLLLNGRRLIDEDRKESFLVAVEDITLKRQAENEFHQFIYTLSHDLQQPLSKVITISELLAQRLKALDEPEKNYLIRMQEAGRRMKILIEDLARYWMMTEFEKKDEIVDLKDLWNEALAELELKIRESKATIEIKGSAKITANRSQMKCVFQNLIANAIKFSKEGSAPHITIENRSGGRQTEILVSDNGIGFDEKYAHQIFEPFYRLHHREGKYEGTGIGLSMVRKIIQNHGGRIAAKSEIGEGSRFTIGLPND